MNTPVGTGGVDLAPRQVQQLALARVLLLDPEVVVMDEATAEGGSGTAQALDRAPLGDLVVVMDDGRVAERGRPDELRSAVCGLRSAGRGYARLWAAGERCTG
ncbi:hypothetical protein [Streptomyces sp. N50]|uniref:hypothetical protein n=1 Tax=Streptomyces sp. N50 TaxID=3081765 RepID=UPI0029625323|nr:hypothetical protein [Streptomyces sp. N50]WOX16475.1 hypothetical protein R2B38_47575 [Streptomyces sp. N50]